MMIRLVSTRPGQTSGRVGFGSGQGRVTGRIGRPAPDPYLSPGRVGLARAPCAGVSGRVFFGLGRVFWPLGRVFRVGSGFGSKITARARPVDCCGSKNTARAHPPRSSGRVGSGFFRAGWVGLFGSGDPCPGLYLINIILCSRLVLLYYFCDVITFKIPYHICNTYLSQVPQEKLTRSNVSIQGAAK